MIELTKKETLENEVLQPGIQRQQFSWQVKNSGVWTKIDSSTAGLYSKCLTY